MGHVFRFDILNNRADAAARILLLIRRPFFRSAAINKLRVTLAGATPPILRTRSKLFRESALNEVDKKSAD